MKRHRRHPGEYRLAPGDLATTKRQLQADFKSIRGDDTPPPRPRRRLRLLSSLRRDEWVSGVTVAAYFHGRDCPKIGTLMAVRSRSASFYWWGVEKSVSERIADIRMLRVVGTHSWYEQVEIAKAQRRGECARL